MIYTCANCGEQVERFGVGLYAHEDPSNDHVCKKKSANTDLSYIENKLVDLLAAVQAMRGKE